jgi:hypothetical protein
MRAVPGNNPASLRDLGGGLILRRSNRADTEALVDFNARIHYEREDGMRDERIADWTRDLMEKPHPTFTDADFTIVVDTATGKIVSTMNLISQTWSYDGITFGVGRPELVGTLSEYRNRGLVRAQFEVIHQWSAERGELVQAITGIPYFYRLFEYEMALSLGGGRAGFKPYIPKLKEGENEPYLIRPANEDDLPFISDLFARNAHRYLVSSVWNHALWKYELKGKSPSNVNRFELRKIETMNGEPVGFLAHPSLRWGSMMAATIYEIQSGQSWGAITPSVIRYLQAAGERLLPEHGDEPFESFGFWLGMDHPVYDILREQLPRVRAPYAWYLRVADLPGFLKHIAPILEQRLQGSYLAGHHGELKITFYRNGLHLVFEDGRLAQVNPWKPAPHGHSGEAAFPGLTFLQLLFGYRSLDELKYAFPDCWTSNDSTHALLESLFPKQVSNVWPVS